MVKALETAHLPTMSGGLLFFFVVDDDLVIWVIVRNLLLCPLSLSVYKGYILALIGSDE